MKLYEVLDKAADEMTARGHAKHMQEDYRGRVCLAGAISLAVLGKTNISFGESNLMQQALRLCDSLVDTQDPFYPSVAWNNKKERTEEEVIDLLRRAAIIAKEQETT